MKQIKREELAQANLAGGCKKSKPRCEPKPPKCEPKPPKCQPQVPA